MIDLPHSRKEIYLLLEMYCKKRLFFRTKSHERQFTFSFSRKSVFHVVKDIWVWHFLVPSFKYKNKNKKLHQEIWGQEVQIDEHKWFILAPLTFLWWQHNARVFWLGLNLRFIDYKDQYFVLIQYPRKYKVDGINRQFNKSEIKNETTWRKPRRSSITLHQVLVL